ncbi:MAG: hypothetical protein AAGG75_25320 [Bacteroidota bacterium]
MRTLTKTYYVQLFLISLLFAPFMAYSTPQFAEKLIIKGDTLDMYSLPLEEYFQQDESKRTASDFFNRTCHTGLLRGYIGIWEIKGEKLYLNSIQGCGHLEEQLLHVLFGNNLKSVPAEWFTGTLNIPNGEVIYNGQVGFNTYHKKHFFFEVSHGTILGKREYINGELKNSPGISRKELKAKVYEKINWQQLPKRKKKFEVDIRINELGEISIAEIRKIRKGRQVEMKRKDIGAREEIERVFKALPALKQFMINGVPYESYSTLIIFLDKKNRKNYKT